MLRRFTIGKPDKHSFRAEPSTGRMSAKASRTGVQNLLSGTATIVKYSARIPARLCGWSAGAGHHVDGFRFEHPRRRKRSWTGSSHCGFVRKRPTAVRRVSAVNALVALRYCFGIS